MDKQNRRPQSSILVMPRLDLIKLYDSFHKEELCSLDQGMHQVHQLHVQS